MPEKAEDEEPAAEAKPDDEEKDEPMTVAKALQGVSDEDRAVVLEAIEKRDLLEKRVAELEDEKDAARFLEISKSMDAIPGKTDERAKLLQSVSKKLDAKTYAVVEKMLRDASETIAKSAGLEEIGSSAAVTGNAKERLEAIAKSLRESDPKLTAAKAKVQAAKQNPELYAESRKS